LLYKAYGSRVGSVRDLRKCGSADLGYDDAGKAVWDSHTEEKRQAILSGIPLRRLARIEEVAAAIAF